MIIKAHCLHIKYL